MQPEGIHLSTDELFGEFLTQLSSETLRSAANQLRIDAGQFGNSLAASLAAIHPEMSKSWSQFPNRMNSWIRERCAYNGVPIDEKAIANPECYVGLRLAYGILFCRYFVGRKSWKDSDYIDYLQASDMAYAAVVVTEHNLCECIRQLSRRPELRTPGLVVDLAWLINPRDIGATSKSS